MLLTWVEEDGKKNQETLDVSPLFRTASHQKEEKEKVVVAGAKKILNGGGGEGEAPPPLIFFHVLVLHSLSPLLLSFFALG